MLNIWLLKTGEKIPTDGAGGRMARTALLARTLVARGHNVTWWNSTVNHQEMKQRGLAAVIPVAPNYTVRLLACRSYSQSRSLARFLSERDFGNHFAAEAPAQPAPDVVIAYMPSIDCCVEAVRFATPRGIPVIVDVRDLWPEIFVYGVPAFLKPLANIVLRPQYNRLREACSGATAIFGITDGFRDYGLRYAGRAPGPLDAAFPLAPPTDLPPPDRLAHATAFWKQLGVADRESTLVVALTATFGARTTQQFVELIQVARKLHPRVQLVVCGDGPALGKLREAASGAENIVFSGWVGQDQLQALLPLATVGILPYEDAPDVQMAIPNKVIEYLSGGLPVVSSARGAVEALLSRGQCGISYRTGDAASLTAALEQLHADRALVAEMSVRSRRLFEAEFRTDAVYGAMADQVERVAASRSKTTRSK